MSETITTTTAEVIPPTDTAPNTTTAPSTQPPASTETQQDNEANKYRRLFEKEKAEKEKLEADAKKRADAELSEVDRAKQEAKEAKDKIAKMESDALRARVAKEAGVPDEMVEFLTSTDEAGLRSQAEKLAASVTRPPAQAGTRTQPGARQEPSVQERIQEAQRGNNPVLAIRLKREQAGY